MLCLQQYSQIITNILLLIAITIIPLLVYHLQKWRDIYQEKCSLFHVLMSYRKNDVFYPEFLSALNVVEVVFHKHQKVVQTFRCYRDVCMIPESPSGVREQKFLDMMSEISKALSFRRLYRNDIQKVLSEKDISDCPTIRLKDICKNNP